MSLHKDTPLRLVSCKPLLTDVVDHIVKRYNLTTASDQVCMMFYYRRDFKVCSVGRRYNRLSRFGNQGREGQLCGRIT